MDPTLVCPIQMSAKIHLMFPLGSFTSSTWPGFQPRFFLVGLGQELSSVIGELQYFTLCMQVMDYSNCLRTSVMKGFFCLPQEHLVLVLTMTADAVS